MDGTGWKGYCIDLIKKLAEEMNFEYELVVKDNFGEVDPATQRWNGLIGGLVQGVSAVIELSIWSACVKDHGCNAITGTGHCGCRVNDDIGTGGSYRLHRAILRANRRVYR